MELNEIKELEKSLELDNINFEKMRELGNYLIEKAQKENKKICLQIRYLNKIIVYYCMDGLIQDNENWLRRKSNSVEYFSSSTLFLNVKNKGDLSVIHDKYGLDIADYCITPGAFPLFLKNVGMVGSIAVSGMKPEEDSDYCIDGLKWYIDKNNN